MDEEALSFCPSSHDHPRKPIIDQMREIVQYVRD